MILMELTGSFANTSICDFISSSIDTGDIDSGSRTGNLYFDIPYSKLKNSSNNGLIVLHYATIHVESGSYSGIISIRNFCAI